MKFVKMEISRKEWENFYSKNSSYCPLEKGKGHYVAFLIDEETPPGCEDCDIYELREVDSYRRRNKIFPFALVLEEEKPKPQGDFKTLEERKDVLMELAKLKASLNNVLSK